MRCARSLAAVALCGVAACAQPESPGAPVDDPLERVVRQVETVRGEEALRPVAVRIVTPETLRTLVAQSFARHRTPEEIERYERGLVTVGLWPDGRPLVDELLAVLGEEAAGLYVAEERALWVVSDEPVSLDDWLAKAWHDPSALMVLRHEIVHLLQHQHHAVLFDSHDVYFENDDLGIAVQSGFEGDAVYYGLLAGGESPPPELLEASFALEMREAVDGRAGEGAMARAPMLLRELLGFPYARGYGLAYREREGLLASPPVSTEQVLHGDRRREPFTVFDLGAAAETLPAGCVPVFENTVGELQLRVLLARHGLARRLAESAAAGWDGDRYLAAACGGRPALAWLSRWDSAEDAGEFAAVYEGVAARVAEGVGLPGALRVERQGEREVIVASDALSAWSAAALAEGRRARVASFEELLEFVAGR